jgi:IS605 OrfB family transposase
MRLRYRYRLDPDPAQRRALAKAFGCARVVFNDGLRAREDADKAGRRYLSDSELSPRLTSQRNLARKHKGSKNRDKVRGRVARLHARVADARRDFHHQLSTRLVREHQTVCVETLNVAGMGRSKLAKSVHDAGWGQFTAMLEYKAALYGRQAVKVDLWYPSSQVCSACGHRAGPKPLKVRSWTCPGCGVAHDRDLNASKNILGAGLALAACGVGVRPGRPRQSTPKQEPP